MDSWNADSIMHAQLHQIDSKYNLGSCQESEVTSSQETRIDDQNDVAEDIDSDATTEVNKIVNTYTFLKCFLLFSLGMILQVF